jgi:hypothetical protein
MQGEGKSESVSERGRVVWSVQRRR